MAYYSAGDLGLNFFWQSVGFLLLFFYTDVIGLPNFVAGVVYAVGGFIDAISDPAMGVLADRTRTKKGRYRPYLLYGAAPLGLAFIMLFAVPLVAPASFVIIAAVTSHILFRLCYTAVSIPYSALGARLTFHARERTSLAGVRMLFGAFGGVAVVSLASHLRANFSDETALIMTGLLAGFAGAGLIMLSYFCTKEWRIWDSDAAPTEKYALRRVAGLLAANTPFLVLIISVFMLTVANTIIVKTVIYRFEYILSAPSAGGLAMTLMTATPLVAIPLWVWTYLKLDKRPSFILGCITVIAGLALLYFTGGRFVAWALASYVIIAAGFSSFAVGFWSTLPDTIDYGHWKTGQRIESGLIGFASAIQKTAIALSGIIVGFALDSFGYVAGVTQTPDTLNALHKFSSLIPLVLMTLSAATFSQFPLSAEKHRQLIKTIEKSSEY